MDKKSRILLVVFALMIVSSVGVTFWRIMIKKDYIIQAQTDCDPVTEKCFVHECDPEAEECSGNPQEDTTYFAKAQRIAANIPLCDPADENCKPWECAEGEKDCAVTFCDDSTKAEDDVCSEPEQYVIDDPTNEESAPEDLTCEEGDEKCLSREDEEIN